MTSQTTSRHSFSFSLMVAAIVVFAVMTSMWAKGSSLAMLSDGSRIDAMAMMTGVDMTTLPVLHVENPM